MTTHILIDANGTVVNSIVWDGVSNWAPPQGLKVVAYDGVWRVGWKWDGKNACDPNPQPPPSSAPPAPSPSPGVKII